MNKKNEIKNENENDDLDDFNLLQYDFQIYLTI
jgi:hypothetical protein